MSDENSRPNLVLVVVDSLRADHVGCYGYARDTTPFLDRIAREGVVFEDVTSQGTYTLPSVASMLTSSYPLMMGSVFDPDRPALPLGREMIMRLPPVNMAVSLQGELKQMGYRTLGWVGGGFLDPLFGFAQGFDSYHAPEREHTIALASQLSDIRQCLSADHGQPFFLFLHTHDAHNYFQGARHCLESFDRGYTGRLISPEKLSRTVLGGSAAGLSPGDLQYLVDLYDGEIRHTDHLLGSFLDWLLSQPWGGNTLLVITSDHGEAFGERGALHHGHAPHPWLVRVPLIIRPLGRVCRGHARRVPHPVSLVDLMPTLIELAGGAAPAGSPAEVPRPLAGMAVCGADLATLAKARLAGRSVLPLMRGDHRGEPRPALCECSGPILLARQGRWWRYVLLSQHVELLFDLEAQPELGADVAAAEPDAIRRLRAALAALSMHASRGYRLAVAGNRPGPLQVKLRAEAGFTYLLAPTVWQKDALRVSRSSQTGPIEVADLTFPPGDEPQVVLFEAVKGAIAISARMGGQPVNGDRYHLGRSGVPPRLAPLTLSGPPTPAELLSEAPPVPAGPADWGIWVWLPTMLARAEPGQQGVGTLLTTVEDQLRALGYID